MIRESAVSTQEQEEFGLLVQAYARAKWVDKTDQDGMAELGIRLGSSLRARIDVLGLDGPRLLEASPRQVLARLAELEHEATREDSGVAAIAARVRAREAPPPGGPHPHGGKPRQLAGQHNGRRHRGKR